MAIESIEDLEAQIDALLEKRPGEINEHRYKIAAGALKGLGEVIALAVERGEPITRERRKVWLKSLNFIMGDL